MSISRGEMCSATPLQALPSLVLNGELCKMDFVLIHHRRGSSRAMNPVVRGDIVVSDFLDSVGGYRHKERRDRLLDILDVDLDWHMHAISDGERRRVQLVMGLMSDWDVLLLDEVIASPVDFPVSLIAQHLHRSRSTSTCSSEMICSASSEMTASKEEPQFYACSSLPLPSVEISLRVQMQHTSSMA